MNVSDKSLNLKLTRFLNEAQQKQQESFEKLSSGTVFTKSDPKPADRALSENLEFKLRGIASAKRNINDAVTLLQTAESSFSEINNMITRMKEINIAAASTTMTNQERRYLFIEYEALYNEITRVAKTTEFNGLPLLDGQSDKVPESLIFRVGDPQYGSDSMGGAGDEDLNAIKFDGLKSVVATSEALGLKSAREYLENSNDEEGIELEDAEELLAAEEELFPTVYDQALSGLSTFRAIYGALQSRLNRSMDFLEVFQENISAAKSNIADTDYAKEITNLTMNNILTQAATAILANSNVSSQLSLNLIASALK